MPQIEHNQTFFGRFGNANRRFASNPNVVPSTREGIAYPVKRVIDKIGPPSVFLPGDTPNIEPTVFAIDLTNAVVDREIIISGNLLWFQSSTNLTDKLTIKYNRTNNVGIPFQPGNKLGGVPYTRLYVSNAATAGATAFLILLQDTPANPITVL